MTTSGEEEIGQLGKKYTIDNNKAQSIIKDEEKESGKVSRDTYIRSARFSPNLLDLEIEPAKFFQTFEFW